MLDQRDLALLHSIDHTISLNRIIAVHTLWETWKQPNLAAEWSYAALRSPLPVGDITREVRLAFRDEVMRRNEPERIRGILMAKLFVEVMSSYEDVGALCFAIKQRKTQAVRKRNQAVTGLFEWYLDSEPGDVRKWVNQIQSVPPAPGSIETLDSLLDLPPLPTLQGRIDSQALDEVRTAYHEYPVALRQTFEQYREPLKYSQAPRSLTDQDIADPTTTHVLIDLLPLAAAQSQSKPQKPKTSATSGEVLVHAFNKLKHRFLLTDDLRPYSYVGGSRGRTLGTTPADIEVGSLLQTETYVDLLVANAVAASKAMRGVAELLLLLDGLGIDLYS